MEIWLISLFPQTNIWYAWHPNRVIWIKVVTFSTLTSSKTAWSKITCTTYEHCTDLKLQARLKFECKQTKTDRHKTINLQHLIQGHKKSITESQYCTTNILYRLEWHSKQSSHGLTFSGLLWNYPLILK